MDTTTILAVISCAVVFTGWLVLPHSRLSTSGEAETASAPIARERETAPAA